MFILCERCRLVYTYRKCGLCDRCLELTYYEKLYYDYIRISKKYY